MRNHAERRHETAKFLQRESVKRMLEKVGDLSPEGAVRQKASVYTDPLRLEKERNTLFKDYPLLVCLSADIPNIGDIYTFDFFGQSIIIVRQTSGDVGAFLNMCTHRGVKLVDAPCRKKLITCPFHGWSFDLNGDVVGIPEPEAFENLDRGELSLKSVSAAEWAGLVFIQPPGSDRSLDETSLRTFFGDFAPELEMLEMGLADPVKSGVIEVDCNWKYALDTYGEAYHFPVLHKETVSLISLTHSHLEHFGKNYRLGFSTRAEKDWGDKPETEWPEPVLSAVHYLFPNTVIFRGTVADTEPFLQVFRLFPDGVGKTKVDFSVYGNERIETAEHRKIIEEMGFDMTSHVVATEDFWVAARGWAEIKHAPADFEVIYGANEWSLQKKHKNFNAAVEQA